MCKFRVAQVGAVVVVARAKKRLGNEQERGKAKALAQSAESAGAKVSRVRLGQGDL